MLGCGAGAELAAEPEPDVGTQISKHSQVLQPPEPELWEHTRLLSGPRLLEVF